MKVALMAFMLASLALAGCTNAPPGDGGDDGSTGTFPAGEDHTQTHELDIVNFAFSEASLTIMQGDTVVWTNQDTAAHTVDSTDGTGTLDSGNLAMGDTFEFTFDDAGTFTYRCDIHSSMTAEIVVQSLAAA